MMEINQKTIAKLAGAFASIACLVLFIKDPSFPTPDKLIVFLFFVFMIFGQAIRMLIRLGPFVALILVYESFRSIVPKLNQHVNYTLAPAIDRHIFHDLPTAILQRWLWRGHTTWYDVLLYLPYLLFFIVPLGLALLIWKTKEKYYWQVVWTYLFVFFCGYLTFLIFPAAPPWLASQHYYIEPVTRVSSSVWYSLGLHDFPSVYNHLAPNPVAAIPSLHSACATLFSLFIFKAYGWRFGLLSLIYPLLLYVGVVYEAEHYFFDVFVGIVYAVGGYLITPLLMRTVKSRIPKKSFKRWTAIFQN